VTKTLPTGILLAAGNGGRFGGNKLLYPLADGTPLAVASARNLLAALPKVVAVVAKGDERLSTVLSDAGCTVVAVAGTRQGTGASIAAGVAASLDAAGWVIALGDMPAIAAETTTKVAASLGQGAVAVAPFYRGQRGHPVGFGPALRDSLLALRGDAGARAVLHRAGEQLIRIDVDDQGVLIDIDAPADLAALGHSRPRGSP